jgi:hypothetical protein
MQGDLAQSSGEPIYKNTSLIMKKIVRKDIPNRVVWTHFEHHVDVMSSSLSKRCGPGDGWWQRGSGCHHLLSFRGSCGSLMKNVEK